MPRRSLTERGDEVTAELRNLLALFSDRLDPSDVANISVLIAAAEWGEALDTLCTQVYEFDIAVPHRVRQRMEALGEAVGTPIAVIFESGPQRSPE